MSQPPEPAPGLAASGASGAQGAPGAPGAQGVVVPFVAPPTERDRKRLWITLGVGAGLLVLCLVGGVVGIAFLASTVRPTTDDASARVDHYLRALQNHQYATAYDDLCTALRQQQSVQEFTRAHEEPALSTYAVGVAVERSTQFDVPARLRFDDGNQAAVTYVVVAEGAGELRVCSTDE